jgi:hypothetical protein
MYITEERVKYVCDFFAFRYMMISTGWYLFNVNDIREVFLLVLMCVCLMKIREFYDI